MVARILVVKHEGVDEDLIRPLVEDNAIFCSPDELDQLRAEPGDVLILAVAPGDVPPMLERLRKSQPGLPVVVLTGSYTEDGTRSAAASGPAEFLSRSDLSSESISRAIRHVTERHRFQAAEEALGVVRRRLDSARRVQQQLFPKPLHTHQLDMWGSVQSRDVSGDFYEFLELPDGRLLVAVGDVTGHGLDAALLMATARAYVRAIVSLSPVVRAADILHILNGLLLDDVGDERFVALSLGLLEWGSGRLDYATAGQPSAYVVEAGGRVRAIAASVGMPLGIEPDSSYEGVALELAPGDRLVMVTDGLLEATSPAGEPFGDETLVRVLGEQGERSARETVADLQQQLERFTGRQQQRDDVTLVVIRLPQ